MPYTKAVRALYRLLGEVESKAGRVMESHRNTCGQALGEENYKLNTETERNDRKVLLIHSREKSYDFLEEYPIYELTQNFMFTCPQSCLIKAFVNFPRW